MPESARTLVQREQSVVRAKLTHATLSETIEPMLARESEARHERTTCTQSISHSALSLAATPKANALSRTSSLSH